MAGPHLAVADLSLSFAGNSVVSLPELSVEPGRLVVLCGPSGSGKSTLLYLLSGLLPAGSGSIGWDSIDLARLSEGQRDRWRRDNAGFIFQDFHLIAELSPLDNVLTGALFGHFSTRPFRQAAAERLDRLGVPKDRKRTSLLSRGEQQRVAIARALLFDPKVVFADEPTASLDAGTGERVIAILHALASDEGRTVLAATHDPALMDRADMLVRLDHGRPVVIETR